MGTILLAGYRRPARKKAPAGGAKAPQQRRLSPEVVLVSAFTGIAVAMTAAVVITASNSWNDALFFVALVFVAALFKVGLVDWVFFLIIQSDSEAEAKLAAKPVPKTLPPKPSAVGPLTAPPAHYPKARNRRDGRPVPRLVYKSDSKPRPSTGS